MAAAHASQAAGSCPRRLGDAQVCGGLGGGQDEEVRDAERTGDVDKVLQLVTLGLLRAPVNAPVSAPDCAGAAAGSSVQSHSSGAGTPVRPS